MSSLNPSEIIRNEQTISGIGYQDGYFRETSKPEELWKIWDHEQRMLYQKSCMYGSLMRYKRDSNRLMEKYFELWKGLCLIKE